ncbi:outer membrane protein transport protein [Nitratidesulfovibrio sp. HK-II]|uniref:OmpP1/FadL family transporter n=1 Tax=Nitratidesulfovibrio sp. HK-II TaxID=2009266 RepID=UPI0022A6AA20|nr:outer membrane protein transport protein [Nitratidesulfovibrio sp. HK-II]
MLCVAAWSSIAQAAGFAMYEFSARGNALGGAMTARRADPSSIAFNPALVTQLEGTQTLAGVTVVAPQVSVDVNGSTTDAESNLWTIPHAYATTQINDNLFLGVGTFSRFGLGTEYPSDWAARNDLQSVSIKSMSVNPVLGVRHGNFALGMGIEAMWFDYDQRQATTVGATDIDGRVRGDATGFGLNGGAWWKATDSVALGASFRTPIKQDLEGRATFDKNGAAVPSTWFNSTGAEGSVTLPGEVRFGVAWEPDNRWSVAVDVTRTFWSSYDELRIRYNEPVTPVTTESLKTTEWRDVWRLGAGVEYRLTDMVDLRAGYVYDCEPVNPDRLDFLVPANDRQLYSLGVGVHDGPWRVDVSYTYLWIKGRDGEVEGKNTIYDVRFHDGDAHLVGLSAGWEF